MHLFNFAGQMFRLQIFVLFFFFHKMRSFATVAVPTWKNNVGIKIRGQNPG